MPEEFDVGPNGTPRPADDLLSQFRADMAEAVTNPDVIIPHKHRPGYKLRFDTDLSQRMLLAWQKRCTSNSKNKEVDMVKLSCYVVANKCVAILLNDQELVDPATHEPYTFGSPFIWQTLGVNDSHEAVQRFMANDGFLIATAEAILRQCGFDDEVAPDPTSAT